MTALDPSARSAAQLKPGEEIVNHWEGISSMGQGLPGGGLVVLTDQRVILLGSKGVFKKTYAPHSARALEMIAEPSVKGGGPEYVLQLAGETVWFQGTVAHAARDEIAHVRSVRIAQLGQGAAPPLQREREVITREIVRIPCRFCGTLVDQTARRCPNCSAPLS